MSFAVLRKEYPAEEGLRLDDPLSLMNGFIAQKGISSRRRIKTILLGPFLRFQKWLRKEYPAEEGLRQSA